MKIGVAFEGGEDLARALSSLPSRVSKGIMKEALTDGAEPMRKRMAALAPRRPPAPDIADNIVVGTARGSDAKEGGVAVGPAKGLFFYGVFLEFGTVKMSAQPFMRPAFDSDALTGLTIIGQRLWQALAGRGLGGRSVTATAPIAGGPGGRRL